MLLYIPVGARDAGKQQDLFVASTQNPELLVLVMGRPDLCTTPSRESALHNVCNRILKYAAAN